MGVDAALDFPLFFTLPACGQRLRPSAERGRLYAGKQVERDVLSSPRRGGRYFVTFLDNHDKKERILRPPTAPGTFDRQVDARVALLFYAAGNPVPLLRDRAGPARPGRATRPCARRSGGSPVASTRAPVLPRHQGCPRSGKAEPALRYGRQYFRPISGDGGAFGTSGFAPACWPSRGFSTTRKSWWWPTPARRQASRVASSSISSSTTTANSSASSTMRRAARPGAVKTRSGLEIMEIDGGTTSGPARMIEVNLRPMEVQVLAK